MNESHDALPAIAYLPDVIDHVGDGGFGIALISILHAAIGAEHCSVFRFDRPRPAGIVSVSRDGSDTASRQSSLYLAKNYWQRDSLLDEVRRTDSTGTPLLRRVDIAALQDNQFRTDIYDATHVGERILLYGGRPGARLGLSILRPAGRTHVTDTQLNELAAMSAMLVALLSKHVALLDSRTEISLALTSIKHIEATLEAAALKLPRREAEVCARTILGVQTAGISAELGIGEETVMTYRKRTYQRLGIATQRELLLWYVAQWGETHPLGLSSPANRLAS